MASLTSMWIASELDNILRDLSPLANRKRVTELLTTTAGVTKASSLTKDICAAMTVYRVCHRNYRTHHA